MRIARAPAPASPMVGVLAMGATVTCMLSEMIIIPSFVDTVMRNVYHQNSIYNHDITIQSS